MGLIIIQYLFKITFSPFQIKYSANIISPFQIKYSATITTYHTLNYSSLDYERKRWEAKFVCIYVNKLIKREYINWSITIVR